MSKKFEEYINGVEDVESEKIISSGVQEEKASDKNNGNNYYTEKYENHGKKKKKKKKQKPEKNRTFAVIVATALVTAILISSSFFAAAPYIMPIIEDFWGIEKQPDIIYIEAQPDEGEKISFDENGDQTTLPPESKESDNESQRVVIDIRSDDQTITKIAKVASPSVVGIKVSFDFFSYFYGSQTTHSQGSGIILSSDGHIITNYHVIQDVFVQSSRNPKIEVFLMGDSENGYVASVVGYEASSDLAVIKIDAEDLVPAQIGDSDKIQVGELAVAIGNPGGIGLMGSVTSGIISGLDRQLSLSGIESMNLIQTDAAINPGNSGGALLNSRGQVIGINEAKIVAEGYEGLGFAIPINYAMEVYERILLNKIVEKNITVGIYIDERYTKEFADNRELPHGLLVRDVIPTSGAFKAGIKINDIITKFNGVEVSTIDEFNREKNKYEVGDVIKLEIYRFTGESGEYITVDVELMSAFDFE